MSVRRHEIREKLLYTDVLPVPPMLHLDAAGAHHAGAHHGPDDGRRTPVRARVHMRAADVSLHAALPRTAAWTYEGSTPGPTLVMRHGVPAEVEWVNEITGTLPVTVVQCGGTPTPTGVAEGVGAPQNEPGSRCGDVGDFVNHAAAGLPAWTVVHLHGGRTAADADGWTENAYLARSIHPSSQRSLYANDQRATGLWYHDHAMGVTRLNVYAGLAGLCLVRDAEEDALGLPLGAHELPLLIQDRNLELEGDVLTGRLVHKVESDATALPNPDDRTSEFFGPFTLVNGRIWPRCPVEARSYRLRLVNGSNARAYQLILLDETGAVRHDLVRQIGGDGGLLPSAVRLSDLPPMAGGRPRGLILAPAERADLIVDFGLAPGARLRWVNVAGAPYGGEYAAVDPDATPTVPIAPGQASPKARLAYPDVMRFDVAPGAVGSPHPLPEPLCTFTRWTHDAPELAGHTHRYLALNENKRTGVLFFNELEMLAAGDPRPADFVLTVPPHDPGKPLERVRLRNRPVRFGDGVNFMVDAGGAELWRILNCTGDTHPVHLHLVQFQALARLKFTVPAPNPTTGLVEPTPHHPHPVVAYQGPGALDANEQGWKDTIRVNPGELVTIGAVFDGYTGRYMYHCHVLEHEDMDMMRPFIVMPPEVTAVAGMRGGMGAMGGM